MNLDWMPVFNDISGKIPGKILFFKVWGSHSHNTNVEGSDVDYSGVYIAPVRDILSIHPPEETIDGKGPDFQIHELRKFCNLLIKGNPAILEMLYTNRYCYEGPGWDELVKHRAEFLSTTAVMQYIGYAQGQLHKMATGKGLHAKGGTFNFKFAYHLIRLLDDAFKIIKGQGPVVWKEGIERDLLLAIRNGTYSASQIEDMAKERIDRLFSLEPWNLPKIGNEKYLNDWLYRIRTEEIFQENYVQP